MLNKKMNIILRLQKISMNISLPKYKQIDNGYLMRVNEGHAIQYVEPYDDYIPSDVSYLFPPPKPINIKKLDPKLLKFINNETKKNKKFLNI